MERKQLLRLCHVCGKLNESESEVLRCIHCGKGFLPINYFEKLKKKAQVAAKEGDRVLPESLNPLQGLIVFW